MDQPPGSTALRIAVTSADPPRRVKIETAVESLGHRICATSSTAAGLPVGSDAPEIVLIALGGSRTADAKAVSELRERFPDARLVLVLTAACSRDRRFAAIGADGIVPEGELDRVLPAALAALRSGLAVLPLELNASRSSSTLSPREKQVLAMVVMGFANVEIATKLYLAESTVKSHLSSSFRKLGVSSRKDAAARILDPDSGLGPGILAISSDGIAALSGRGGERNASAAA
jgi:DNA-binding NarL/FixJ family response regulator